MQNHSKGADNSAQRKREQKKEKIKILNVACMLVNESGGGED